MNTGGFWFEWNRAWRFTTLCSSKGQRLVYLKINRHSNGQSGSNKQASNRQRNPMKENIPKAQTTREPVRYELSQSQSFRFISCALWKGEIVLKFSGSEADSVRDLIGCAGYPVDLIRERGY